MNYFSLPKRALSTLYRKARVRIKCPRIEVEASAVFDRLGNAILDHPLLDIFNSKNSGHACNCYGRYTEFIIRNQAGAWLEKMIGKKKDINYWITPWGGALKKHGDKYHSNAYLIQYTEKILAVRDSIERFGYRPKSFGYITGQLLINEQKEERFIIWNGHRRSLSLINLGYEKFKVEISGGNRWNREFQDNIIRIEEVNNWENVKNGFYTKEEAIIFFRKFFK